MATNIYSEFYREAIAKTLGHEGGYVNDPNDPGGETKWGIAKRYNPSLDIKNLTRQDAIEWYHANYWKPMQLDKILNYHVAAEMFDTAVNQGQKTAIMIAQGALILLKSEVKLDGRMGPQTIAALNNYPHKTALLKWMNVLQAMYYLFGHSNMDEIVRMVRDRLPHVQRYGRGWLNRVEI